MNSHIVRFSVLILILVFFSGFARQIESIADIEKAAQNPLADRIFLEFRVIQISDWDLIIAYRKS